MNPDTLTPEQIDERAAILAGVDDAACEGCNASAYGTASNAEWFIDTEARVIDDGRGTETRAIIRCPVCW
jgi:hypothetical protein